MAQDALLPSTERRPGVGIGPRVPRGSPVADPAEPARRNQVVEGALQRRARQRHLVTHLQRGRGSEPIDDRKHLIGAGGPRR